MIYQSGLMAGAVAGALRSILGWLESDEPFNFKQFLSTLIRATVISAAYGFSATLDPVSVFFYVFATDKIIKTVYKTSNKKKTGE